MWRLIVLTVGIFVANIFTSPAVAASDGLEVSSSRISMNVGTGEARPISYTVTNNSNHPIDVRLQVKQFSVDPKKHLVKFETPKYDWIEAEANLLTLKPDEKKTARFTVAIPENAASKEYHFALVTSTDITSEDDTKTIQVAPLVYLYVEGKPVERKSIIQTDTRPGITMSSSIPYSFDIQNKGNVHLESDISVRLEGLAWHHTDKSLQKLILPSQSRSISGSVAAPYLPGLYTMTYITTDDVTGKSTQATRSVIVVPPWTISALILLILLAVWGWQFHHKRRV